MGVDPRHPAGAAVRRWLAVAGFRSIDMRGVAATRLGAVDAAVLDVRSTKPSSLALLEEIRAGDPAVRTLAITDRADTRAATSALNVGASFVLAWPTSGPEVLLCIAELLGQGRRLREQLARFVGVKQVDRVAAQRDTSSLAEAWHLTPRERAVLPHLVIGEACKDVAARLATTPRMVRFHGDNIRRKAGGLGWPEIRAEWIRNAGGQ